MKNLKFIQFIFFLALVSQSYSQSSIVDSLKASLETAKEDTSKVNSLNTLASNVYRSDPVEAIKIGSEAKNLAEQLNFPSGLAYALKYIGLGHFMQGNYIDASMYFEESLEIFESIEDDTGIANMLGNLGTIYANQAANDKAIEYFLKSLKIAESNSDSLRIATCLLNIGGVYSDNPVTLDKALEYFSTSIEIGESNNYLNVVGIGSSNVGDIYFQKGLFDSALIYFEKSLSVSENESDIPWNLNSIGKVYAEKGDYYAAIKYQQEALEMAISDSLQLDIAQALLGLANTYRKQGNPRIAIDYFDRAKTISEEIGLNYELRDAYEGLAFTYVESIDYQNAYYYLSLLRNIENTIYNTETNDRIRNLMFTYQLEKKEDQIEIQKSQIIARDATIKQQKIFRNSLLGGLGAFAIIVFLISFAYVQKKKDNRRIQERNIQILEANEELQQLNEEIHTQKEEIETQRDFLFNQKEAITESINYARRIQLAMLPPESYINELLDEVFILFRPRDIVSGDFYWFKQVNQYNIVAAADCTGHGVPGAFMSMLGMSFLTEIVHRREITQANQVLDEMRRQIKHSLRQHGQPDEAKDGIDMAICVIDQKTRVMQYAGANNPLYIIQQTNGKPELNEIKADRMPIGYYAGKDKPFTNHEINLEYGDTFYLFSDGFIDQKGGKENKKYMSKNFKRFLLNIHEQPMYDQRKTLEKELADWLGNKSQIDDILVIGVRT